MPVRRHIAGPPLLRPNRKQLVLDARVETLSSQIQCRIGVTLVREQNGAAVRHPYGKRFAARVRRQARLDTPGEINGPEVPRADSRLRPLEQHRPAVGRQAHVQVVTGSANGSNFFPSAIDPDESRDVRVRVIRDRSGAGCGEHRPPAGEETVDRLGNRDRRTDDPLARLVEPLGDEHAFLRKHEVIGIDPLDVRHRGHDRPRGASPLLRASIGQ